MRFHYWLVCRIAVAGGCFAAMSTAVAQENARALLVRSLQAQCSPRSMEGSFRMMFTNFAPDDDTPVYDRTGRFTLERRVNGGEWDRLASRESDNLRDEPGDSSSQFANGKQYIHIGKYGTGEEDKPSTIRHANAVAALIRAMEYTQQMLEAGETEQLQDTLIGDRRCYLFALHTVSVAQNDTTERWCRMAVERGNMLPTWVAYRNRGKGVFNTDQSGLIELWGLRSDIPVDSSVFNAPAFRREEPVKAGSCGVGEKAALWSGLPNVKTGNTYALDSLLKAGNVVVMDWSTSSCGACLMAMPTVDSLFRHYRKERKRVAFVMMDHGDTPQQALGMVERKGIEYPVLLCPKEVANAYGLYSYPVFLVVDHSGRIVFNQGGFGGDSEGLYRDLSEAIETALAAE